MADSSSSDNNEACQVDLPRSAGLTQFQITDDFPSEAPPNIQVTANTPATAARQDPILATQDSTRPQLNAAIEDSYRAASSLMIDPALAEKDGDTEKKMDSHVRMFDKVNDYCAAYPDVFTQSINVLQKLDLKSLDITFAEVSRVLLEGVNLLGQLHPFVKVVVTPLELILAFDLTRRQNTKKVTAVKMQILDTATLLFRLRNMRDEEVKGPDGLALPSLANLLKRIADDITECANACDMYLNKKAFFKFIRAKDYEERFGDFIKKFDGHQRSLTLELTTHTAIAVDTANDKLDVQRHDLVIIKDLIERLFRKLDTADERAVQTFIDAKGGAKACIDSDPLLKELAEKTGESLESLLPARAHKADSVRGDERRRVLEDARTDFNRKLKAQETQLTGVIEFTGTRVISALYDRLHTKVKDLELQKLWERQKWRGSVEARDFIMSVAEYFASELEHSKPAHVEESAANLTTGSAIQSPTSSVGEYHPHIRNHDGDNWALAYINLAHSQPLLDVIDTDGTGWINIAEINHFTRLRPPNRSLLHWFAFWAAGWQLTVTWYRYRIYSILVVMLRTLHHVKPANIQAANTYMDGQIYNVELLLRTTRRTEPDSMEFHKLEEDKLKTPLDRLRYNLDNKDTLQLVTGSQSSGPRRIEVHIYPLLYLVLLRHLAIMQLACVHNLHADEFSIMSTSLGTIFSAVNDRMEKLVGMFKSNVKDGKEGFTSFAFGMFSQLYRDRDIESDAVHNTIHNRQNDEDDGLEDLDNLGPNPDEDEVGAMDFFTGINPSILLNKIPDEPAQLSQPETQLSPAKTTASNALDGMWTGKLSFSDGSVPYGTIAMRITAAGENFHGGGGGGGCITAEVAGTFEENTLRFTITWPDPYKYWARCKGHYAPWADTIVGTWGEETAESEEVKMSLRFVFHRPPSFRGTDASDNRARERWAVAIGATINMFGPTAWRKCRAQLRCSWLVDRLAERKRFVDLARRDIARWQESSTPWGILKDDEAAELQKLKIELRPSDARVYTSLAESQLQQLVDHDCHCNVCSRNIYSTRRFCLQCLDTLHYGRNQVDLCPDCREQTVVTARFGTHTKFHTLAKTTRRLHDGDLMPIATQAQRVADQVKERLKSARAPTSRTEGPPQPNAPKSQVQDQPFRCCYCEKSLTLPFWACVECVSDTYVCLDCDAKGSALGNCGWQGCLDTTEYQKRDGTTGRKVNPPKHAPGRCPLAARLNEKHKLFHVLVQPVEAESVVEPQVANVTLVNVMTKLVEIEKRLAAIEEKLEAKNEGS
ncbi:hypothetical protein B0H16DRAFT_1559793 [Mycena metata]|uniref:Uncharacterized protein n=1 Tax=Mycena metata TaxID=1033252 RepID=A0AAD7IK36_9AGAR|nr:hypothetical protein B0H16DRAFT_1559793 [Mycena metata]